MPVVGLHLGSCLLLINSSIFLLFEAGIASAIPASNDKKIETNQQGMDYPTFCAGTDFRRQNLTSIDVRTSVPALKE